VVILFRIIAISKTSNEYVHDRVPWAKVLLYR
jgi:hypothetical protein